MSQFLLFYSCVHLQREAPPVSDCYPCFAIEFRLFKLRGTMWSKHVVQARGVGYVSIHTFSQSKLKCIFLLARIWLSAYSLLQAPGQSVPCGMLLPRVLDFQSIPFHNLIPTVHTFHVQFNLPGGISNTEHVDYSRDIPDPFCSLPEPFHFNMQSSTPFATPAAIVESRRRNGKKLSCENYRKSKLACDHTLPVCGRCVRRKCREPCVYHPAPMTKLDTSSKRASQGQPRPAKRPLLSQGSSTPDSTEALDMVTEKDYSREGSLDLFSTSAIGIPDLKAQNDSLYASEFLGSINYRAILDEYQIEVEPKSAATETSITAMPWRRSETLLLARTALLHLPSRDTCYCLIDRSLEYPDLGAHLPSLRSLNETF